MNLQRLFRRLEVGHTLHAVYNGEEALHFLRDRANPRPHLVLLDLHLPLMSGLEFLHSIRQDPEFESMAVYVLTSSDLPQDLESARSYNVVSYVVKPFTPEKYREVIQALVASWDEQSFETID